jgi:hypothetical protein
MDYKKILNNSWIQGIIVSIISSILLNFKDADIFKYPISLGIVLVLITITIFSHSLCRKIYLKLRIRKMIKKYTSCYYHGYPFKWEYVKSKNGIFGYEPINIRLSCLIDNVPLRGYECPICRRIYCGDKMLENYDFEKLQKIIKLNIYRYVIEYKIPEHN